MSLKNLFAQSIIWRGFYFFSVLLVNIFLSRYLHAAITGNLYFITLVFTFMYMLFSLSAESGIIYFVSSNIIQRNKLISLIGLWSVGAGLAMVLCTYLFFVLNHSFDKHLMLPYCIYSFLFVAGQAFINFSLSVYYSKGNYFLPNFLIALVNILFVFIIPSKNNPAAAQHEQLIIYLFFATYLFSGLLIYIFYIILNRREGEISFPDKEQLIGFLKYSVTALAANLIFFVVYKVDYAFVKYSPVCNAADLGNYIQVSKLGQMMLVVPQIIASVVFPRTASGVERMKINNAILVMARILSQLFFIVFIIVLITGNWLFIKAFGESFNEMQLPMLIVIPGIFSLSLLALLSAYFSGKGKLKINLYGAIIGFCIMIIGDFIFVPRYGIIAAAAISTLSYTANLGYSMLHFYRDYTIHWSEFIGWRRDDYNRLFALLKKNAD